MPPAPPSQAQVTEWVQSGHITAEQALALLAHRTSRANGFLGPTPLLAEALPALAGLAVAITVAALAIVADTVAASKTRLDPGDLLSWLPIACAAAAAGASLLTRGGLRSFFLATAFALPCLFILLHPAPQAWMFLLPPAAAILGLFVPMDSATRVAISLPAVVGIVQVSFALLERSEAQTPIAVFLLAAYLFALGYTVPFASGWRRVPLLLNALVAAVVAGVFFALVLLMIARGEGDDINLGVVGGGLVLAAYPAFVYMAWSKPASRAYLLPRLAWSSR